MNKLAEEVDGLFDEMVAFRRDLHAHPELQWEEVRTTEKIAAVLTELAIPFVRTKPTGIIANLEGRHPGKTVALRADMDALPVYELNRELSYRSVEDGKMHACGHDVHTAMLVTAAKVLKKYQNELHGTVRFIFQPSEENAEGADEMVRQGAVEGVDNAFGIHIWSQVPVGQVAVDPGSAFASADVVTIDFKGKGGHGAMPEGTIDAAVVASSFVMNAQAIVAREVNPLNPVVFTVGKMEVGTRFNVIAENARLEGTVRCFDEVTQNRMIQRINEYADHVAGIYGATAKVNYRKGTAPVINEESSALFAQSLVTDLYGIEAVKHEPPTTGGEDFSAYIQSIPGCFALVGSGNPEKDTEWAHHHGRFNIDEEGMRVGATLYANYAFEYLNK